MNNGLQWSNFLDLMIDGNTEKRSKKTTLDSIFDINSM